MSSPQAIICGSIAIDRIMNFSGQYRDLIHPDKLHVLSLSVLLEELKESPGGVGANIANSLALLGDHPVLLGSVGHDAEQYINKLSAAGINTNFVHFSSLATASFNVITDIEGSQVGGFYPGAMSDSQSLTLKPWSTKNIFVVISPHDPKTMKTQVAECQKHGLRLLYDPGQQVMNVSGDDLQEGVAAAEVVIVNDYEASMLAKKITATEAQLKSKVPIFITTYGKDGSIIEGSKLERSIKVPAVKPTKVVDPTGAGDAYRAGFIFGHLRQWDLNTCGQLGAVVASFVIEQHGTQPQLSKESIMKRYQATFKERIEL